MKHPKPVLRFGTEELDAVQREGQYAATRWSEDFDEKNTLNDWVTYICMYATDAAAIKLMDKPGEVYGKLVKAANLALLAAARVRKNTIGSRHYDTILGTLAPNLWDEEDSTVGRTSGPIKIGVAPGILDDLPDGVDEPSVIGPVPSLNDLVDAAAASGQRLKDSSYNEGDISDELWRDYTWTDAETDGLNNYRIDNPQRLVVRQGGSTHRVVDSEGVVHCVPAPGHFGCVLTWKTREGLDPVAF